MFYHEKELQYPVEVENPDPVFAKMLQEAIGGVEGEMRIAMQYLFQAWSQPDTHGEYRDMLLNTATEEIGHIEILAELVGQHLEGAPMESESGSLGNLEQGLSGEQTALSGMAPRQILSSGMHALAVDAEGVPFSGNYVVATGNIAADMYANILAESSGRLLVSRLYEMTDDEGTKDALAYLIARDTHHQNQWLSVLDELEDPLPVPSSFPQDQENQEYNYAYLDTRREPREEPPDYPFVDGESYDGHGTFSFKQQPGGGSFSHSPASPQAHNDPVPAEEEEEEEEE